MATTSYTRRPNSTFLKCHTKREGDGVELNELIRSIDIVEYISQYVDLEQRGEEWWGLSCFKEENTPSFSVRQDPAVFYDYSSGIGGNLFTFVKHYNNCSSTRAVEIIKNYAGYNGEVVAPKKKMDAVIDCLRFKKKKPLVKQQKSKVLPDDYMERYEKRKDKLAVWMNEGISEESIEKYDVYYDAFSNRLVYPIRNIEGKIVNVGGRTLDPAWKEKKLRKYTYFHQWGTMNVIYGLYENMDAILEKKEVILFEGCKSVLLADTWGIHNTGALLTSHLNPSQMLILIKLGFRVVFALDKDVLVRDDHNIRKLRNYVTVEYLCDTKGVLEEKDAPVDKGYETFADLYENRRKFR